MFNEAAMIYVTSTGTVKGADVAHRANYRWYGDAAILVALLADYLE